MSISSSSSLSPSVADHFFSAFLLQFAMDLMRSREAAAAAAASSLISSTLSTSFRCSSSDTIRIREAMIGLVYDSEMETKKWIC